MSFQSPEEPQPNEHVDFDTINQAKVNLLRLSEFKTPLIKTDAPLNQNADKMAVYLRIRPFTAKENSCGDLNSCVSIKDSTAVDMCPPKQSNTFKNNSKLSETHRFLFTKVFDEEADQKTVFDCSTLGTLQKFLGGQNCLTFCYGVTNSGKTFTVQGTTDKPGIIPRTMDVLFNSCRTNLATELKMKPANYADVLPLTNQQIQSEIQLKESLLKQFQCKDADLSKNVSALSDGSFNKTLIDPSKRLQVDLENRKRDDTCISGIDENCLYSIWISFAEVYNENIYDLLESVCNDNRTRLRLVEDRNANVFIKGLQEINVQSADEACKLLFIGQQNLKMASTKLNHISSRSHCIFNVRIVKTDKGHNHSMARTCKLSFCDLAGSERSTKTHNTGIRLKEANNINNSLMVLGRCIANLRHNQTQKQKIVVPYRDSKLTRLFQNFFTGRGQASMIANISPSSHLFDETIHALRFSALAQEVVSLQLQEKLKPKPSKLSTLMAQPESRLTIAWVSGKTSYCPSLPTSTEEEDGQDADDYVSETASELDETAEEEDEDVDQQALLIDHLKEALKQSRKDNITLEGKLRKEFAADLQRHLAKVQSEHDVRLQATRTRCEELMESRMELMEMMVQSSRKRPREDDCVNEGEDLMEKQKKMLELEEDLTRYQNEAAQLKQSVTQLQFKCSNYESELGKLARIKDEEHKSAEQELNEANNTVLSQKEQIKLLTEQVNESSDKMAGLNQTISSLQCELNGLKDQTVEQTLPPDSPPQSERSMLDFKLFSNSDKLSELNKKAQDHLEKVVEFQPNIADYNNLKLEIDQLKMAAIAASKQFEADKQDIIKDANRVKDELRAQIATSRDDNDKMAADIQQYMAQVLALESELTSMKDGKLELTSDCKAKQDLILSLENDKQILVAKESQLMSDIQEFKVQVGDLSSECKQLKSTNEMSAADLQEVGAEVEKLKQELTEKQDQYTALKEQKNKLADELSELRFKMVAVEADLETLQQCNDNESTTDKLDRITSERDSLLDKMAEVKVKVLDLLFATDNKKMAEFEDKNVFAIIETVKLSIMQLGSALIGNIEKGEKIGELENSLASMRNILAEAEANLQAKDERIGEMKDVLLTQDTTISKQDVQILELTKKCEEEAAKVAAKDDVIRGKILEIGKLQQDLQETKDSMQQYPATPTQQGKSESRRTGRSCHKPKLTYADMDDSIDENKHPEFELPPSTAKKTRRYNRPKKTALNKILSNLNSSTPQSDTKDKKVGEPRTRRRRKLLKNDISEPFMCTPPLVSIETKQESVHSIVTRQLRHRK